MRARYPRRRFEWVNHPYYDNLHVILLELRWQWKMPYGNFCDMMEACTFSLEKNHCDRSIARRLVCRRGSRRLKLEQNQASMDEEEIMDGLYWFVTTLRVSAKEVPDICRSRNLEKRAFKITMETI
jgi:hypothetical protein